MARAANDHSSAGTITGALHLQGFHVCFASATTKVFSRNPFSTNQSVLAQPVQPAKVFSFVAQRLQPTAETSDSIVGDTGFDVLEE
jgi:hypothetical protein